MPEASQRVSRTIWIGIALVLLLLLFAFLLARLDIRRRAAAELPEMGQVATLSSPDAPARARG
jgi:hypothetical protein